MGGFFESLFQSRFMPHGHCYFWEPGLLVLQVGSDALIAVAYYSIPLALIYFVKHRPELAFDWMFLLFATFIFACGTTHLLNIVTVWHPIYWAEGSIKLLTAIVSCTTAALLWPLIPRALTIPSPGELQREIETSKHFQSQLQAAHHLLEKRVRERTFELEQKKLTLDRVNKELSSEVEERRRTEEKMKILLAELDHRVKNSLGVVQAMANQMLSRETSLGSFKEAFSRRIHALARMQRLLTANRWEGAALHEILRMTLEPYVQSDESLPSLDAVPPVQLAMAKVQPLYLVFHELALNAAKYGCFSTEQGTLHLAGRTALNDDVQWLEFEWREQGGPPRQCSHRTWVRHTVDRVVSAR